MRRLDFSSQSAETAHAIERMLELYGDDMYRWLARLYDPEIGGFYYSNSARDYEGFLPDVESTAQALYGMGNNGLFEKYNRSVREALPDEMRLKIIEFTRSLQDEDGYFYHKQWGKDIPVTRRGRDLSWSVGLIKNLGGELKYPTAQEQISSGATQPSENLRSKEAFVEYLHTCPQYVKGHMHHLIHTMNARQEEIRGAGLLPTLFEFLEEEQSSENGLWGKGICYDGATALMKATLVYSFDKRMMNYTEAALESCIKVVLSDEVATRLVDITNPWVAMINLVGMVRSAGDDALADEFLAKIRANAPALIDATTEKLKIYSQPDKTFSFLPEFTNPVSQNVPVALKNEREGDINATLICYNSAKRILTLVGVESPEFFGDEEYREFLSIIDSYKPTPKKKNPQL
ncbi:MAG: hypothetical protein IJW03_04870 [Clostridia bacterium]|nr:hypothetical protein [Clostridia bacterium]